MLEDFCAIFWESPQSTFRASVSCQVLIIGILCLTVCIGISGIAYFCYLDFKKHEHLRQIAHHREKEAEANAQAIAAMAAIKENERRMAAIKENQRRIKSRQANNDCVFV